MHQTRAHCITLQHTTTHCNPLLRVLMVRCQKSALLQVWRRLIGYLKLQVIFRKRATKYRALLRKITCKDKASYDSTPPCNTFVPYWLLLYNTFFCGKVNFEKYYKIWCFALPFLADASLTNRPKCTIFVQHFGSVRIFQSFLILFCTRALFVQGSLQKWPGKSTKIHYFCMAFLHGDE